MTVVIDVYRVMTSCTSLLMILSPIPMIWNILKIKNTGVASIVPLLSMVLSSHTAISYGYLKEDYFPIFATCIVGESLSLIYTTIFYIYTYEKQKAHRLFLLYGIAITLMTTYAFVGGFGLTGQTRRQVGNVFGYFNICTNILLYSSPFEKVTMVLKHRSSVFLNVHMICVGTFNNSTWLVYTTLTHQWLIFIPNVLNCTMGCLQIVLYFVFHPSTHPYDGPIPGLTKPTSDVEVGEVVKTPVTTNAVFTTLKSPV